MDMEDMKKQIDEAFERERLVNTKQLDLCPKCNCATFTLMDKDGNRYCGKCKERRKNDKFD